MWTLNSCFPFFFPTPLTAFPFGKECIYWEKWVDLTLDHILQDRSPDLSPALGQDQDHILEKRDTGKSMSSCINSWFNVVVFVWELFFACMMLWQK